MASPPDQQAEHDEPPGSGFKTGSLAKEKHSATEKRRRDRIAEGYRLMASHLLIFQCPNDCSECQCTRQRSLQQLACCREMPPCHDCWHVLLACKAVINEMAGCRMTQLKDAVLPGKEKEDQAGFLRSAANYIRQLQVHIAPENCSLGWLCLLAFCGLNIGSIEGHSAPIAAREAAAIW